MNQPMTHPTKMNKKKITLRSLSFPFILCSGMLLAGCPGEGPAEEAGEAVDEVIEDTKDAAEDTAEDVKEVIDDAKAKAKEVVDEGK